MKPLIHDALVIFLHITSSCATCSLFYSFITLLKRKNKKNLFFPTTWLLLASCFSLVSLLITYIMGSWINHHVYIGSYNNNGDIISLFSINVFFWISILCTWACCHSKLEILEDRFLYTPAFGRKKQILF